MSVFGQNGAVWNLHFFSIVILPQRHKDTKNKCEIKPSFLCAISSIIFFWTFLISFSGNLAFSNDSLNVRRTWAVTATSTGIWAGTMSGLYFVWYDDFPKSELHSFNDGGEWQQMDKAGHVLTTWNISRGMGGIYQWCGVSPKKSALIGMAYSLGYQTTLELFDASSSGWGFSWWDMASNTIGAGLFGAQEMAWQEQRFKLKFSSSNSGLSDYRPEVLGEGFFGRTLKDYNGQTYWLSVNPVRLIKPERHFPKWLCISFGYGINDQLIGDGGTYVVNTSGGQINFEPYRQYYLSLDVDLEQIPVKSKMLKEIFRVMNVFKVPCPALELSRGKLSGHWLSF